MKRSLFCLFGLPPLVTFGANPQVAYVNVEPVEPGIVKIAYKVDDPGGAPAFISLEAYDNIGQEEIPVLTLTGDGAEGEAVASGEEHTIVWDAREDWSWRVV